MKRRSALLCAAFAWVAALLPACRHNRELAARAAAGDAAAQYEYGRRLLTGQHGLSEDPEKAYAWLSAAAEQGNDRAEAMLGLCHERGLGVDADVEEARRWYMKSAEQGNANACRVLVQLAVQEGDIHEAGRWLTPLAERGSEAAQLLLGKLYLGGLLGERREAQAVRYLRFAAMQGNGDACLLMGACYANGTGVPKDEALMLGWLNNAADCGNEQAAAMLETMQKS